MDGRSLRKFVRILFAWDSDLGLTGVSKNKKI